MQNAYFSSQGKRAQFTHRIELETNRDKGPDKPDSEFLYPDYGVMNMNTLLKTAALSLSLSLAAGAAYADTVEFTELTYPVIQDTSSKSRADVVNELDAARAAGQLDFTELSYPVTAADHQGNSLSRAQVREDLRAYRAQHPNEHIAS